MEIKRLTALCALFALGCGPSASEVRRAKQTHYTCDFEVVFKAVLEIVEAEQPPLAGADPEQGVVMSDFRWHDQHGARKKAGAAMVGEGDVAFAVVVGIESRDRGFYVRAVPRILAQQPDSPRGMELTRQHANWPRWADTKADKLLVLLRERLGSCAVELEGS